MQVYIQLISYFSVTVLNIVLKNHVFYVLFFKNSWNKTEAWIRRHFQTWLNRVLEKNVNYETFFYSKENFIKWPRIFKNFKNSRNTPIEIYVTNLPPWKKCVSSSRIKENLTYLFLVCSSLYIIFMCLCVQFFAYLTVF